MDEWEGITDALPNIPIAGCSLPKSTCTSAWKEPLAASAEMDFLLITPLNNCPGNASMVAVALFLTSIAAHSLSDKPIFKIHLLEPDTAFINRTGEPGFASSPSLPVFLATKPSAGAYILEYCWLKATCCKFCFAISTPVFAFCNCSNVATLSVYKLLAR